MFAFFVLAAALAARLAGPLAGAITLVLGIGEAAYFLLTPIHSFRVSSYGQLIRLCINFLVSALVIYILSRLRTVEDKAHSETFVRLQTDERLRYASAIIESSDDAIIGKSLDGIIKSWNRGAEALYGYSADEVIGRHISILLSAGQEDDLTMIMQSITAGEPIHRYVTQRRRKDGTTVSVQLTIAPIRTPTGEIVGASTSARDMSRIIDAERRLRMLAAVVESSGDFVGLATPDFQPFYLNDAGRRMMGLDSDSELTQFSLLDHFCPEDRARVENEALPSLRTSGHWSGEVRFRNFKTGKFIHTIWNVFAIRDEAGKVVAWATISPNINKLKEAEKALRDSEERFRGTFDQAAVGMAHVAFDGRWIEVNQKLCNIVGYTREQMLARTFQDITHPDDLSNDLDLYKRLQHKKIDHYSIEKRYIRKEGSTVWINLTVALVNGADGQPSHAVSVIEDISERKRVEQALRESESRLKAVLDSLPVGVFLADPSGQLIRVNPAVRQIWGQDPLVPLSAYGEYKARFIDTGERLKAEHWGLYRTIAKGETVADQVVEIETFNGSRKIVSNFTTPVRGPNNELYGGISVVQDITERTHAEVALRNSEEALRQRERELEGILELLPIGVFIADKAGKLKATNRAADEIWGKNRPILQSSADYGKYRGWLVSNGKPLKAEDWAMSRALNGEHVVYQEVEIENFAGERKTILNAAVPLHGDNGGITGAVTVNVDLTKFKEAENALRESEERLRLFIEHAPAAIAMLDRNMRYLSASRRWLDDFGLGHTRSDFLGRSHYELFPEIPERWKEIHRQCLGGAVLSADADPFTRQDGSVQWLKWEVRPWHTPTGEVGGLLIASEDVSERVRIQDALRESEQKFRTLAENVPQMIWVVDTQTNIIYLSPKWIEYTGTSPEQNARGGWLNVVHPDDKAKSQQAWMAATKTSTVYETEYRMRRYDGEYRWHLARAIPIVDQSNRTVWFGTSTDIEDQKRAQEALIRSEKLASVGRMAATVAHEVNNPLAVITNSVYIAAMDPHLTEQTRKSLEIAEQELKRVAHLTRQTLGFYRETTSPADIDIGTVVDEVVSLYSPRLTHRGISVRADHRGGVTVHAIGGEIRQVVSNIIANAIDACSEGGTIRVRTRRASISGKCYVRMTFADTGEGIAPANLKHIFEPFFTTKQAFGTGLGLWVSHEIVRRHQGSLRVRSKEGKGTVFSILLPENGTEESSGDCIQKESGDWQRAS